MKYFYSFFCLSVLLSLSANSQSNLLGTWYLDHIIKDEVVYNNYYNDNTIFDIEFTDTVSFGDYLEFNTGHGCNASNGIYIPTSNEITIEIVGTTLADCLTTPHAQYETLFLDELTYDEGATSIIHNYTITGADEEEVLTLINEASGNSLVYKKQQPNTLLVSTWWLHQIDIPGNSIIDIPQTDAPNIIFTNTISTFPILPEVNGFGECEIFNANYSINFNGGNNIQLADFVQSLGGCPNMSYESTYFQILADESSNFFEFEIINNGSTLILTDLLGARLIYGDSTLSIEENNMDNLNISIRQNPVKNLLRLDFNDSILNKDITYQIYSIEGKLIKSSDLKHDSINVEYLNSGIYFIHFLSPDKRKSIIKFSKK